MKILDGSKDGHGVDDEPKILIIDDEPANVALLEDLLLENGYTRVKAITDSRLAIEVCNNFAPDLVLLDWLMPHLDGVAVLEGLRARDTEIYLPVIVLTADVTEEAKLSALQAGATDYLHKPFDHEEVLLRIGNLLQIRRLFTNRRRTEQNLQQLHTPLQALQEESARWLNELEAQRKALDQFAIVAETDARGIITYANDQFCKVSKYSREELLGKNHNEVVNSGYHSKEFWREFWQAISKGNVWRGDICNQAKDGTTYWVDTTIVPRLDASGKPEKYLAIRAVITERKLAEGELRKAYDEMEVRIQRRTTELEQANQAFRHAKEDAERANHAKSEFLSRMSHELRTPLNAILGFGQLLERQSFSPAQRTRIGHMTSAGRHLLKLINEVLDISRIEAGHMGLDLEPVCLARVLGEALDLIRPLAAERAIEISTPVALGPDCFIRADRQRLVQVLLNLLSNAVKYTPIDGKVSISCSPADEDELRIAFTDTGAGIAADKLTRLFTPFDRLGAEDSAVEGTGLGLALCQRLMQAMGGSIGASSTVGQGSTFWIALPRADAPLSRLSSSESAGSVRAYPALTGKCKILYIEDNLANLNLVEEILHDRAGVELLSAMQGQLGLDLARKHAPDLILLDLHLPDLHGSEVLARLQASEETRHIPVVVISADATARQIKRLMAGGARAYLTKPLDVAEFFRVVEETAGLTAAACD